MTRVVNREDFDETVSTKLEPGDAAIGSRDPHGFEFGRIEGAHEVQGEDADCSGVTEDRYSSAAMLVDDLVQFLTCAIE